MKFLNKILKREAKETAEPKGKISPEKPAATEIKTLNEGGRIRLGIIRTPRLTEKTAALADQNKFVFTVTARANKVLVKQAVEERFGVKVRRVSMVKTFGKERKRGRQIGWKPGIKKAIVTLAEGQTLEFT